MGGRGTGGASDIGARPAEVLSPRSRRAQLESDLRSLVSNFVTFFTFFVEIGQSFNFFS